MNYITKVFKGNYIFLLFTSIFAFLLPISTKYSNYLLLGLLGVICLNALINKKINFYPKRMKWPYIFQTTIIIVVMIIIGLLYSSNIPEGLNLLKHYIYFLLVPVVFMGLDLSALSEIRKKASYCFIVGSIVSSIVLLISNFYKFFEYTYYNTFDLKVLFSYEFTYHEFAAVLLFHPTMLGLYFTFAFAILNENRSFFSRGARMFFKIILLLCLIFLNSRTAFLFMFIYLLYYLINLYKNKSLNKKLFFRAFGGILVVGVLCFVVLKNTYVYKRLLEQVTWELTENKGTSYDGVYSNDSRMSRWKAIVDKSSEQPFLGFGTGMQGIEVLKAYEEHDLQFALKYKYDPHNYYLFILIEHGLIGLGLFIYFLLYQLLFFIKRDSIAFILLLFVTIGCIFDSILYLTPCILFFTFFSNLCFFENKAKFKNS